MPGAIIPPAPIVVGPTTKSATKPSNILPQYLQAEAKMVARESFNADRHITFQPPLNVISMKDIGLEGHGISPTAVSEPFPLFSEEAVRQMRAEIFSEDTMRDCQFESNFNKNMIRGMGPKRAPFTYAAWKSPELLAHVSAVAGIELVPAMDYEIANINVSVGGETSMAPVRDEREPLGDTLCSVAWHYDSFPFVCVVMLSSCAGMVGGETALRTASGEVLKVRGPTMGTAVVLQGRYIEHQALKAFGGRERISMITPFRPKSPLVRDETVLTGVRGISYRSELYPQYLEYRLDILQERIRAKAKAEQVRERAGLSFGAAEAREWLVVQKEFLQSMIDEIVEE